MFEGPSVPVWICTMLTQYFCFTPPFALYSAVQILLHALCYLLIFTDFYFYQCSTHYGNRLPAVVLDLLMGDIEHCV